MAPAGPCGPWVVFGRSWGVLGASSNVCMSQQENYDFDGSGGRPGGPGVPEASKTPPRRSQGKPKTHQEPPRRPQGAQNHPQTTISGRFSGDIGRCLEDFWKTFWKNLPSNLPPQTYFRKKPASTNSLSKKASLKNKGPAVFAAGVGNPPAPSLPGVQERVQDSRTDFGLI